MEWDFWVDQKTVTKKIIGKVDQVTTAKLRHKAGLKSKARQDLEVNSQQMTVHIGEAVAEQGVDSDELDSDVFDDPVSSDYELQGSDESSNEECDLTRNRYQYPKLSKTVDR